MELTFVNVNLQSCFLQTLQNSLDLLFVLGQGSISVNQDVINVC